MVGLFISFETVKTEAQDTTNFGFERHFFHLLKKNISHLKTRPEDTSFIAHYEVNTSIRSKEISYRTEV
jgi:hypothetical protein